jgi:putative addiction module component (TIGR02574 family)
MIDKWSSLMGSPTLEKLRSEALVLPESERAELAHYLVTSLDGPSESDVANAWDAEILRRLAEIDSGTATLIDRQEFSRRMRSHISRP